MKSKAVSEKAVVTNEMNGGEVELQRTNITDVGQTLKAAGQIVKKTWINLTAWTILWYIVGSTLFFVGLIALLGVGWWQLGSQAFVSMEAFLSHWPTLLMLGGVGLSIFILLGTLLTYLMQSGYLLVIGTHDQPVSLGEIFGRSFRVLIPMLVTGFLVGLLVIGGFGLFIIPGIIISIMTMFWMFEVVLGKVAYGTAIQNSVTIFKQNFGFVFERWLVMVGLAMAWGFGVMIISMIASVIPLLGPLVQILIQVGAVVFGWFVLAFWYVVYSQAKAQTDLTKKSSTVWMWVVAVVGWIMLLVIGYGIVVGVRAIGPTVIKSIQEEIERGQNEMKTQDSWNNMDQLETNQFNFDLEQ